MLPNYIPASCIKGLTSLQMVITSSSFRTWQMRTTRVDEAQCSMVHGSSMMHCLAPPAWTNLPPTGLMLQPWDSSHGTVAILVLFCWWYAWQHSVEQASRFEMWFNMSNWTRGHCREMELEGKPTYFREYRHDSESQDHECSKFKCLKLNMKDYQLFHPSPHFDLLWTTIFW